MFTLLELATPIATLTLNRPQRHNSLIPALLEEMLAALETIGAREDIAAVILQANGRSFSTGGDLQGFVDHLESIADYAHTLVGLLNRVILALLDLPAPIIAAVHGTVTGGSLGLILASDIVLVTPQASFTPYYSVVGFSPDGGWTALLPALIGLRRASEILLANRTITAEQAVAWGLANRLIPNERLLADVRALAQQIAVHQPTSVRQTKRLLRAQLGEVENSLEAERKRFIETIRLPETQQSMRQFYERMARR